MARSNVANAEYPLTGNQSAMAVCQSAHPAAFLEMMYAYFHSAIDQVLITRAVLMGTREREEAYHEAIRRFVEEDESTTGTSRQYT